MEESHGFQTWRILFKIVEQGPLQESKLYSMLHVVSVLTHYLSMYLQVSVLSYGAWVTFGNQLDVSQVRPLCLSALLCEKEHGTETDLFCRPRSF